MHTPGDRFTQLVDIMRTLRSPGGCPWDREQTLQSLRPFLLEETYEALEAIDSGDPAALREELGDLLFEVVFLAQIADERGTVLALPTPSRRSRPSSCGGTRTCSATPTARSRRRRCSAAGKS